MKTGFLIIIGLVLIGGATMAAGTTINARKAKVIKPAVKNSRTVTPAKTTVPAKKTTGAKPTTAPAVTPAIPSKTGGVTVTPAPTAPAVTIDPGLTSAAAVLLAAEEALERKICELLPTTADRMPTQMLEVNVHIPNYFNTQINELGDTVTFSNITNSLTRQYKNEQYLNCLYKTLNSAIKECTVSMTANFGGDITEKALLKMSFTGNVGAYKPQNPVPVDTTKGDHPVSNTPYEGMDPMPMLTRTACSVSFQKPCPAKTGSVLCGQCDYDMANGSGTTQANLGKCFYCASNQKCTWGSYGLCGSYSCTAASSGNSGGTKTPTTYFTSCSGCQKSGYQRSYSYNGTNRNTCQQYLTTCNACGATDKRTNCQ